MSASKASIRAGGIDRLSGGTHRSADKHGDSADAALGDVSRVGLDEVLDARAPLVVGEVVGLVEGAHGDVEDVGQVRVLAVAGGELGRRPSRARSAREDGRGDERAAGDEIEGEARTSSWL